MRANTSMRIAVGALLGAGLTGVLLAAGVRAGEGYDWSAHADGAEMRNLPPAGQRCSICHAQPSVDDARFYVPDVDDAELRNRRNWTPMGWDWYRTLPERFGDRRVLDLLALNSDGDGCSNGFELGPQGSDPNTTGDCTLPITDESWSTLKALFSEPR